MWTPDDHQQRQQALDVAQSWIVQAPAGSGKTGILVYRILRLLALAESPEQILAITFTRKAAKEMRDRLLELLTAAAQDAAAETSPLESSPFELLSFEQQGLILAKAVLRRDAEQGWQLLDMPHRLNIETIDALCARLVGSMPWLSRLGERPNTTDKANEHFHFAVEQLLAELLDEASPIHVDLRQLMLSLDNNYLRAKTLLTAMLNKRDQWLRHFVGAQSLTSMTARDELEQAWRAISESQLSQLLKAVPLGAKDTIIELASFAAGVLNAEQEAKPLAERQALKIQFDCFLTEPRFPRADFADMHLWQGVSDFLLTASGTGTLRKAVNKNMGFLPGTPEKTRFQTLLANLDNEDEFVEQLAKVTSTPPPSFSDEQWQQLQTLEKVLRRLLSHLQLRFHNSKECDFGEVAQRANLALRDLGRPTDLALRMDYQIQHILVDEFQDTSHAQSSLLENLTLGWQRGDGRTLFLVGDPMQSIYRFREADVGLFLEAASVPGSINDIDLKPLVLSENFRSDSHIVTWFNQVFAASFPRRNDETSGAIVYSAASNHKTAGVVPKVCAFASDEEEAQHVVATVKAALLRGDKKIAILVRGRTQLAPILPALSAAGIAYDGVDIRPLSKTQSVLDIIALCKALVRLDDKVAWLAVLRGPMVGLSLTELSELTEGQEALVWERLQDRQRLRSLPMTTQQRLNRFITVLQQALKQKQQVPLAALVQWTWWQLGGEQTLSGLSVADLEVIWSLISDLENGGDIDKLTDLDSGLEGLFAQSSDSATTEKTPAVTVSTIHKSKGLQYDTVILPCLSKKGRNNDKDILRWAETVDDGRKRLLIAPLESNKAPTDKHNSHYQYLQQLEKARDKNEQMRLLYVACTRAQSQLHLSGVFNLNKAGDLSARGLKESLLAGVWGHLQADFAASFTGLDDSDMNPDELSAMLLDQSLQRLPADFTLSHASPINWRHNQHNDSDLTRAMSTDEPTPDVAYDWASSIAQATGIVLHDWLQHHSHELQTFQINTAQKQRWRAEFKAMNLADEKISGAVKRMSRAISNMQQDPRAQWLFAEHPAARNEHALSSFENGKVQHHRIDRTFIDDDTRWIIDYKSTVHFEDNVAEFIEQQMTERGYTQQLNRYGKVFRQLEDRPIKLGVYFPLLGEWREWAYEPTI